MAGIFKTLFFTIHESTRPGVTALIAAFSTTREGSSRGKESSSTRKIANEGTRNRCNEPCIVDGTPINYSSHIKNHSDLFFTWSSLVLSLGGQARWIFLNFDRLKTRFDPKIQLSESEFMRQRADLSNFINFLKNLRRISSSSKRFRGDFVIFVSGDKVGDEVG